MKARLCALAAGCVFGFVLAWAQISDPSVIRDMLLLRDSHVFLIMGSAIVVAATGTRLLRAARAKAILSGEPIQWTLLRAQPRHVAGSVLFGIGWSIAGTCPGPAAAMIGEGKIGGLVVAAGILGGVTLQQMFARGQLRNSTVPEPHGAAGL